jgi:hypothetical protein
MIKTEIIEVTPKMAELMLDTNSLNRKPSQKVVDGYSIEMSRGDWTLNGESIKISNQGALLDGQHRLMACIKSGVTFKTMIINGLSPDAFDTIDIGKKRLAADTLFLSGESNSKDLAAVIRLAYLTEKHNAFTRSSGTAVTPKITTAYLDENPEIRRYIPKAHKKKLIQKSIYGCLMYLMYKKTGDESFSRSFFESIMDGTGVEAGSIEFLVRNFLINNAISNKKCPSQYMGTMITKAINYKIKGITVKRLSLKDGEKVLFES